MKTLRILTLVIVAMAITSCSKNDDTVIEEEIVVELTTAQLLASGPWYYESINGTTLDDCEKQSSFNFTNSGNMIMEQYNMFAGVCEYDGSHAYNYTLSDMLIIVEEGGSGIVLTIDFISESELIFTMGPGGASETYNLRH